MNNTMVLRLLKWSEKYTKTDMVYLVRGGFWLSLGHIFTSLASFILALAFANLVSQETFGIYKYILALSGVFSIFSLAGIDTALAQAISRGYEGSIRLAFRLRIKWGFLGGLIGIITAYYYFQNGNNIFALCFLIVGLFIPTFDTLTIFESILQGKKLFSELSKYRIISQLVFSIIFITTILITKNIVTIIVSYFLVWTIIRLFFLFRFKKKYPLNNLEDKETLNFGKHLSLMKGIGTVGSNIGSISLFHILGSQPLAIYAMAISPIEHLSVFMSSAEHLLLPKIAGQNISEFNFKQTARKALPFLLALMVTIALYIILSPYLYKILFPKYTESIFLSQIYSLTLFFPAINIVQITILKATKAVKALYITNITEVILNIGLTIPMVMYFNIFGLIYSIIIIKTVSMLIMGYFIFLKKKTLGISK